MSSCNGAYTSQVPHSLLWTWFLFHPLTLFNPVKQLQPLQMQTSMDCSLCIRYHLHQPTGKCCWDFGLKRLELTVVLWCWCRRLVWKKYFMQAIELCIPHTVAKVKKNPPWINRVTLGAIRKRDILFRAAKLSGKSSDLVKFKRMRNQVMGMIRHADQAGLF